MTDGRPDDDSTLEDGPELLKEARAGNTAAGPGYPDDDVTVAADPDRLAETDADVAPPQGHPHDDTIAADPDQLAETDADVAPPQGHPHDETIAADPHRLTEADLADAPSQGLPDDDTIDADPELLRQVVAASAASGAHDGDETVIRDPESLREAQAVTAASHAAPQESRRRRWLVALAIPIVLVGALAAWRWLDDGDTPDNGDESAGANDGDTPDNGDESAGADDDDTPEPPDPPPPDRPTIRVSGGENRATADWSAVDNGSSILEWEIDDGGMPGDASTAPNATSHTWTNVPAGTYTITVRARNAGGPSPPATTTVTVAQSPPDTPTIHAVGGENSASAIWLADDNGSTILEWGVDDGGMPEGPGSDATSYEWANVDAGSYTITVSARNAGGWSLRATATVQVTSPAPTTTPPPTTTAAFPPPGRPTIEASGGENSASAYWSADDNGATILEWEINDGGMPGEPGSDATSYEWADVEARVYTITVSARNASGWSLRATATVNVIDPAPTTTPPPTTPTTIPPPDRPTIHANGGENRASANWSAVDNGSTILEWEINDGGMPGGPGRTATSHTWTNVNAGTYTITVRARNAGGWSPRATSDVTVHQAEPGQPQCHNHQEDPKAQYWQNAVLYGHTHNPRRGWFWDHSSGEDDPLPQDWAWAKHDHYDNCPDS